jgi:NAD-dependent DNA ligase
MNIVFTGPGSGLHGEPITRAELKAAAEAKGHTVKASVTLDTEMLVASRTDTVKAQKAAARGIVVVDYRTFVAECLDGEVERTNAQPDLFIDSLQPALHPALAVEDML